MGRGMSLEEQEVLLRRNIPRGKTARMATAAEVYLYLAGMRAINKPVKGKWRTLHVAPTKSKRHYVLWLENEEEKQNRTGGKPTNIRMKSVLDSKRQKDVGIAVAVGYKADLEESNTSFRDPNDYSTVVV